MSIFKLIIRKNFTENLILLIMVEVALEPLIAKY
jgi:hypothetical protein